MIFYRIRRHFLPSPTSLTIVWAGLAYIISSSLCLAFSTLSTRQFKIFPISASLSALIPFIFLLIITLVLIEKKTGGRATLSILTTISLFVLCASFVIFPLDTKTFQESVLVFLICCTPVLFFAFLLSLIFLIKTFPEFSNDLFKDRAEKIRSTLKIRSELSYKEIQSEIEISPMETSHFIDLLIKSGFIMALNCPETGMLFTIAALLEKQRLLPVIINTAGQLPIDELAQKLLVTPSMVEKWITNLARIGEFSGYYNINDRKVVSSQIEVLAEKPNCPNCGASLDIAGNGVNQCIHCQAIFFIPDRVVNISDDLIQPNNELFKKTKPNDDDHKKQGALANLQHLMNLLKPSPLPKWLSLGLIFWTIIGITCFFSILTTESRIEGLSMGLAALGLFYSPVVIIAMIFHSIAQNPYPKRLGVLIITLSITSLSFLSIFLAMWVDSNAGPKLSISTLIILGSPVISIFSIPIVYTLIKSWPEISHLATKNREIALANYITKKGKISFIEISSGFSIPLNEVDNLLDQLLQKRIINGTMNIRYSLFITADYLSEKQSDLLIKIKNSGEINFDKLASELDLPNEIIQNLIFESIQMNRFSGYINWKNQKIYSQNYFSNTDSKECPGCGNHLSPGLFEPFQCRYCGLEIQIQ